VRLLREALEALGEGDSVLHARTLASLARALTFIGSMEWALAVHQQAAAMARRVSDPSAQFVALKAGFFAGLTPEKIEEQLAITTEMLRLAEETGDRGMALEAHLGRLLKLMELGDIQAADLHLEACTRLAEELRQPFYRYLVVSCRAMRAIFGGQFEESEHLAQQALAIGQRLKGQDGSGVFGMQMFTLRREQGRLSELAPAVRSFVQLYSASSTWRPGLALIYSELGLEPEARAEFERLAANDFTGLPKDALWSTCIAYLAEVCAFLGDTARAATLYRLLLPYAGYNLLLGFGLVCYGSASRYLGLLATTISRWQEAERHFEHALETNARMGAKPWLAHTQQQYAEMLLARGQPGDREKAVSLLDEALPLPGG
jgi:tetratricopeptide (TPR) repeat protein